MSRERDSDADAGRSAGARAIDARAAIATAQLRSTVTSIGSALGSSSPHGERIVESVDELVAEVIPELEAAEAMHPSPSGPSGFGGSAS